MESVVVAVGADTESSVALNVLSQLGETVRLIVLHDERLSLDPSAINGALYTATDCPIAAAQLAERLAADALLMLSDNPIRGFTRGRTFGLHVELPNGNLTSHDMRALEDEAPMLARSIEAMCRFVEHTGKRAAFGPLSDAASVLAGTMGTQVMCEGALQ